jgi:hypothetical protein
LAGRDRADGPVSPQDARSFGSDGKDTPLKLFKVASRRKENEKSWWKAKVVARSVNSGVRRCEVGRSFGSFLSANLHSIDDIDLHTSTRTISAHQTFSSLQTMYILF